MIQKEQLLHFDALTDKLRNTLISKGSDYNGEDKLGAFKYAASIAKITPEQVALVFISTKIHRLSNLLTSSNTINHESIADNVMDLIGYAHFLDAIIQENSCAGQE